MIDEKTIEEICSSTWEPLYRFIYYKVQNRQEAEDITQETYVKALAYFQKSNIKIDTYIGYLKTISLNVLRDKWRKSKLQGKVGSNIAEIQSPIEGNPGILGSGGVYAGVTNISSIRWQEKGFEYAVVGDANIEDLGLFVKSIAKDSVQIPSMDDKSSTKPQVAVPVNLEIEENEQKAVDAGHSPWKLDPAFVAQVFVSLQISTEGIVGDYPVPYEDFKVTENTGATVIIELSSDKTPISKVYLKKLVRQDNTGIWTVIGYDLEIEND